MDLLNRILVATDFSLAGRVAVTRTGQLVRQHNAKLHMVHVTPDWKLFSRWTTARREHYEAVIERAEKAMGAELAWVSAVGVSPQLEQRGNVLGEMRTHEPGRCPNRADTATPAI